MRIRALLMFLLFSITTICAQSASLSGTVTRQESGEPVFFAKVRLFQDSSFVSETETDFDGNYNFANITAGIYDVELSYDWLQTQFLMGVVVNAGKSIRLYSKLKPGISTGKSLQILTYEVPKLEIANTTTGSITSAEIRSLPTRNVNGIFGQGIQPAKRTILSLNTKQALACKAIANQYIIPYLPVSVVFRAQSMTDYLGINL